MSETNFLRRSQVVGAFGPGALVDLPETSVIVAGLNQWSRAGREPVAEPRLAAKLAQALEVPTIALFTPPAFDQSELQGGGAKPKVTRFVKGRIFPTWFVTQEPAAGGGGAHKRRRLVHWSLLTNGRYNDPEDARRKHVVPTRFVCACPRGHVDDIDWRVYAHKGKTDCTRTLWIEERGTSGDVADVVIGCDCGQERPLYQALSLSSMALGHCQGKRPWLGFHYVSETCGLPNRLLVRTASNAYFPELMSVISLPDHDEGLARKVDELWDALSEVQSPADLVTVKKFVPKVKAGLDGENDDEVLKAIARKRDGEPDGDDPSVKAAEFDVLAAGKERIGRNTEDSPFYAETLDRRVWDRSGSPRLAAIDKVVLVHRLREVVAQVGFTRFEAASPDAEGELEIGIERAMLDESISWLPAVENRGEGIFLQLDRVAVEAWASRGTVLDRNAALADGFNTWKAERPKNTQAFRGAAYVMIHSLSHLLMTAIAMDCGYPASSLRERVYAFDGRYGILIHTGSSGSDGTLGGLVEAGRRIAEHLERALDSAALCSNDPVCAEHRPHDPHERRFLHGAACHGCLYVAETSCEARNDFLDRSLVVMTIAASPSAAFFPAAEA